jgi:hypothetical protein
LVPEIVRPIMPHNPNQLRSSLADGLHSLIAPESVCSLQRRIFA